MRSDLRLSQTPLVDTGLHWCRKWNGLHTSIPDPSRDNTTICNGRFIVGSDGAVLIEGFTIPAGAPFQMDALRMVGQTHYHFHPFMESSFYGCAGGVDEVG